MEKNVRLLAIPIGRIVGAILLCSALAAPWQVAAKELTLEQKVQKALDIHEVQNVMARHAWSGSAGRMCSELETIWAKKRDDISFGSNAGKEIGRELVYTNYCIGTQNSLEQKVKDLKRLFPDVEFDKDTLVQHTYKSFITLTTPLIEVAGDGQTAKGVWYAPGYLTHLDGDKFSANWMWERYAIDFVKEDGEWKIWHFNVFTDLGQPFEKSWVEQAEETMKAEKEGKAMPRGAGRPMNAPATINWSSYRPDFVGDDFPLPEPYETFSETFSY